MGLVTQARKKKGPLTLLVDGGCTATDEKQRERLASPLARARIASPPDHEEVSSWCL
jgi:hypothetical protein